MSARDRDRLKVSHEAERGHLTQKQAGVQLKVSERWVRKLVSRLRKEGDGGILHRLRQAGVQTLEEANAYLEQEYMPLWNRRFTVEAENATGAHRAVRVRFRDRYLEVGRCEPVSQPTRSASARSISTPRRRTPGSPWMKGFHLRQGPRYGKS